MNGRTIGNLILMTLVCVVIFVTFMAIHPAGAGVLPKEMFGTWCISDPNSKKLSKRNCYGNPNVADQVIMIGKLYDISIAYAIWPHCRNGPCYNTLLLLAYCPGGTP